MKKLLYTLFGIALLQLTSGCGETEKAAIQEAPAIKVEVSKSTIEGGGSFVSASGRIEAADNANVSTRMMGNITDVFVKVGDQVKEGTLLVSINNADLRAKRAQVGSSIAQAQAGYDNAKKDLDRFNALFEQGSASEKELDDMTTRFQMAEAGLKAAEAMKREVQAQFAYVDIRAPFSGIITNTFVKEGDMANPGMPLLSIESAKKFQVSAMVSESDIDAIKGGMKVDVHLKSLNVTLAGKVDEISKSAKNTGGQYLVKINLLEVPSSVLSGMFVNVKFPIASGDMNGNISQVMIPKSALVTQGQLTGVYTIGSEETAILRWLRIGKTYGDQVEVLSGLSADESFVVSAASKLYNGAKVSIN